MYSDSSILFLHALSGVHAGAGEGMAGIDLPIQRERHTTFPKIESSGIKGALKESYRKTATGDPEELKKLSIAFGSDKGGATSSSIDFTDARILLFPVASAFGVFTWVTCPMVLAQFELDMQRLYHSSFRIQGLSELSQILQVDQAFVPESSNNRSKQSTHITLNEYPFECIDVTQASVMIKMESECLELGEWLAKNEAISGSYFSEKIKTDISIISNDNFKTFINYYTEVISRIKINSETGVVEDGALFTEEFLPAQSLAYCGLGVGPVFLDAKSLNSAPLKSSTEVGTYFSNNSPEYLQVGGDATIGKGIMGIRLISNKK